MDKIKIIVVEDNIVYCEFVCNLLAREGFRTVRLSTSRQRGNFCNKPLTGTSWFQTCAYLTAMVSTCCVGCAKRV